jgi:hypothetical protein
MLEEIEEEAEEIVETNYDNSDFYPLIVIKMKFSPVILLLKALKFLKHRQD